MRLWFSETLMGGITQALFTRRGASCCLQAWGAAEPGWAGLAPWGETGDTSDPKTPEWGGMPGHLHCSNSFVLCPGTGAVPSPRREHIWAAPALHPHLCPAVPAPLAAREPRSPRGCVCTMMGDWGTGQWGRLCQGSLGMALWGGALCTSPTGWAGQGAGSEARGLRCGLRVFLCALLQQENQPPHPPPRPWGPLELGGVGI